MTILIIDNDTNFTHFLTNSLSEHNINVVSSLGVFKNLTLSNLDLIIVNIDCEEYDSIEVKDFLNSVKTPKIIITCQEVVDLNRIISVTDFLSKSLNNKYIVDRILFNLKKLPRKRFSEQTFQQIKACLDKELIVA